MQCKGGDLNILLYRLCYVLYYINKHILFKVYDIIKRYMVIYIYIFLHYITVEKLLYCKLNVISNCI